MTKFPKALVAAGLAAVLVGCGGGSSESETTNNAAESESAPLTAEELLEKEDELAKEREAERFENEEKLLEKENELAKEREAEREKDELAQQKKLAEGAGTAAEELIGYVNNYSVQSEIMLAHNALDDFQDAISDVADPTVKTELTMKLNKLTKDLEKKKDDRDALIAKNAGAEKLIKAFGDWKPSGDSIRGVTVNVDKKEGTITANGDRGDSINATERPSGWTAREFETGTDEILKVFTNHDGNETIASYEWAEFWGNNNSAHHYERSNVFGPGASNVTYTPGSDPATRDTFIDISVEGTSKVHISDVTFRGPGNDEIELPGPGDDPALIITGTTLTIDGEQILAGDSEFLGVEGDFLLQGTVTALHSVYISVDNEGFIVLNQGFTPNTTIPSGTNEVETNPNVYLRFQTTETDVSALDDEPVTFERYDTSFMTLGYWMDTPDDDDYDIETFATANYGPPVSNMNQVRGKAEYEGDAVGAYVMNTGTMKEKDLYRGEFTADVKVTATFGRSGEVEGMISGFDSVTDDHDLDAWELTLEAAEIEDDGSFSGETTGGGGAGEWEGQFHGNRAMSTRSSSDDQPEAVVGEFSGDFGNYNQVVGVFGAEHEDNP